MLGPVSDRTRDPRAVSHALFGNAAFAEAVASADRILTAAGDRGTVTTRQVAAATGASDSVIRPVMRRLADAGLLAPLPRTGPGNGPQPYARARPDAWDALRDLVECLHRVPGLAAP